MVAFKTNMEIAPLHHINQHHLQGDAGGAGGGLPPVLDGYLLPGVAAAVTHGRPGPRAPAAAGLQGPRDGARAGGGAAADEGAGPHQHRAAHQAQETAVRDRAQSGTGGE